MAGEVGSSGETPQKFKNVGIILPISTQWEPIKNPEENLKKWGWESKILDKEMFGRITDLSENGEPKYKLILDEFNKGTSFLEFGKYLFGPLAEWLGAQIGENCYDTDLIAATAKRAGAERILNTPDRLLGTYILSTMLGNGGGVGGKPSEGYVGGGVGGEEKPSEMPSEEELFPEKEKIKEYIPKEIEKLKKDIDNMKKYISKYPELAKEYENILRKIAEKLKGYKDIMAVWNGIYLGDLALRKYKTKNNAWREIDTLPIPEDIKYCAKTYVNTKDPLKVIDYYRIYADEMKKYDSGGYYGG